MAAIILQHYAGRPRKEVEDNLRKVGNIDDGREQYRVYDLTYVAVI